MKLVWCPETASKAYIDGVRAISGADRDHDIDLDLAGSAGVAELLSAMAGGWNARLVVEAPEVPAPAEEGDHGDGGGCSGRPAATSVALAAAARRTGGRYACVLPDERSAGAYYGSEATPAVVVGEAGEAMARLQGVDLLVVDTRRRDSAAVLSVARPGARGMVVVRHGGGRRRGATALAAGTRVVRSVYLPIGRGVEVLHVGVGKGPSLQSRRGGSASRWIRHVDHDTGEEHVFRRQ